MNRNDLSEIFEALGGKSGFIRWSKKSAKNLAQAYQMLGKDVLQSGDVAAQRTPVDDAAMRHTIEAALAGIITARKRGDFNLTTRTFEGGPSVDVNTGVSDADTHVANRPGIDHGISDTANGMREVAALQALPTSESKPTAVSTPSTSSNAKKPVKHGGEVIAGLCAGDALDGRQSEYLYNRNWSQTRWMEGK